MLSVTQSSDGFLWFTSLSQNMYRYDGVQLVPWTLSVGRKPIDRIMSVFADRRGGLWAIDEHEIVHLKGGAIISHFPLRWQMRTEYISEDPDGSLWVMQAGNDVDKPICNVTDSAVRCFGKADGISMASGESVLADGKGGFWLGGQRALVHWHGGTSESYPIQALRSNIADGILALAVEPDGSLWVGIGAPGPGAGLGRLEKGVFKSFATPTFDGSKLAVSSMTHDREGSLWVGTEDNGLFRVRGNVVEHYGRAEGLSSDSVWGLLEDREGILWVTTTNGIDSFRDPAITTFSAVQGLALDDVVGVLASRDGTVWVANADVLEHIGKDGAVSSIRGGKGLPRDQVSSMLEDRGGNLWVGVYDGLFVLRDGQFHRISEPDHQPFGLITAIAEDTDGNVWAACFGKTRKLVRISDFQVRQVLSALQLPSGRISSDPHGGIWIGTHNRKLVLFRDSVQQKFDLDSEADLPTNDIIAQADGSILAAFNDGLVGLRQGRMQRMTTRNGLPCNTVYSLIEDKRNDWWLNTSCGIVELTDSEVQRWWANPETVMQTRIYDALDGARPGQAPFNSTGLSPDGRVWFATGVVIQMVDPSKLSHNAQRAETYVESITADRRAFEAARNLRLPPNPKDLQIDYTSPTFLIPQRVKFRYRLDPYDRDWHDAGTRRQAFYTDLPPGKYSFRVMASNSEGVWNESAAKLDFTVAPAYYQTNWFRVFCAFLFLALLWAVYQWRVRQLQKQFETTLEVRVGERTRIARDLHDTLLQSFHGLLLRFQTVSVLLPERPIEAKEKLDSAIDQAAGAITEGRDAVQGLRASTVERNDLALAISTLGEELENDSSNHRPATFRVSVEGEPRDLHPILRDEIYKIAAEALRNAFHHSQAKQVEVELRYDDDQFRLRVRDDGKGIDPALLSSDGLEGHYGLRGMRERATLIKGKLAVWSEVDSGTEVELRIPASAAYTANRKRSWLSENFFVKPKV
jgi:signal transduction histidine kinase/ligand-binding sensor domain-containing protein